MGTCASELFVSRTGAVCTGLLVLKQVFSSSTKAKAVSWCDTEYVKRARRANGKGTGWQENGGGGVVLVAKIGGVDGGGAGGEG